MRVKVDKLRAPLGVADRQTRFLPGLAQGRVPWSLARLEVAAWLHPTAQALVQVQYRAARPGDDRGAGHVHRVGVAVKRVGEAIELGQEPLARSGLALA